MRVLFFAALQIAMSWCARAEVPSWNLDEIIRSGSQYSFQDHTLREWEDPAWVNALQNGTAEEIVALFAQRGPVTPQLTALDSLQGSERLEILHAWSDLHELSATQQLGFSWEGLHRYADSATGGILSDRAKTQIESVMKNGYTWGPGQAKEMKRWASRQCGKVLPYWNFFEKKSCVDAFMAQYNSIQWLWLGQANSFIFSPEEFKQVLFDRKARLVVATTVLRLKALVDLARSGQAWSSPGLYDEMQSVCAGIQQKGSLSCDDIVWKTLYLVARAGRAFATLAPAMPDEIYPLFSALDQMRPLALELDRYRYVQGSSQDSPYFDRFKEFWTAAYQARLGMQSAAHPDQKRGIFFGTYLLGWADESQDLLFQEEAPRPLLVPYTHPATNLVRMRLAARFLGASKGLGVSTSTSYSRLLLQLLNHGQAFQLTDDEVDAVLLNPKETDALLEKRIAPCAVLFGEK